MVRGVAFFFEGAGERDARVAVGVGCWWRRGASGLWWCVIAAAAVEGGAFGLFGRWPVGAVDDEGCWFCEPEGEGDQKEEGKECGFHGW